jgi:Ca2+/Na+ antiporter
MFGLSNDELMTLGLAGLGIYFLVLLVRGLWGYSRFRQVRSTAILTWPVARPSNYGFLLGLGVTSLVLTAVNFYLRRPVHHVVALFLMALYFVFMVPLARRIELGLYRDGVWADSGFLPYGEIARMAFREGAEIVLVLVPRGSTSPFRLPVPPAEYGAVRRLLQDKIRTHDLNMDGTILGLEG